MNAILELMVRSSGIVSEVGFGEAMIVRGRDGQPSLLQLPVNPWLMPEDNRLTLSVSPLDAAADVAALEVRLGFPGDLEPPLARFAWRALPGRPVEAFHLEIPFEPPSVPPTRLFTEAAQLPELSSDDARAAVWAGLALHDAIRRRDVDRTVSLLDYRMRDVCFAYDRDLSEHRNALRDELSALVAPADFALLPVDPGAVRVRPCCGDRVFHLTRDDGRELVIAAETADAYEQPMQVYVGRIDGRWRVVR